MRVKILFAATLLALAFGAPARASSAQDEERRFLDAKLLPAEGRSVDDFVPRGWKLEEQAEGDLNGDGAADAALRLVEDLPKETAEGAWNTRFRALVVLFRKPGGGFSRAALATRLLYCSTCGGMLSDPEGGNIVVEIKRGVLNVLQLSGAREANELTQRFRYDPRAGRFALIGEDNNFYDRLTLEGTYESTNYLTGVKVTKKTRSPKEGADPVVVLNRRTRADDPRRFIEDIDYEPK